jgi:hypothetical protein
MKRHNNNERETSRRIGRRRGGRDIITERQATTQ